MKTRLALALSVSLLGASSGRAAPPPQLLGDFSARPVPQSESSDPQALVPWKGGVFYQFRPSGDSSARLAYTSSAGTRLLDRTGDFDFYSLHGTTEAGLLFSSFEHQVSTWDGQNPPIPLPTWPREQLGVSRVHFDGAAWFISYPPFGPRSLPIHLYRTDGTIAGTKRVLAVDPVQGGFGAHRDRFLFAGSIGGDAGVFRVDPATATAQKLATLVHGGGGFDEHLSSDAGSYFPANDGVHGLEWWISDGTITGTHLVQDLTAGPYGSNSASRPTNAIVLNDELFVIDWGGGNDQRLIRLIGPDGGPQALTPAGMSVANTLSTPPSTGQYWQQPLAVSAGRIFFRDWQGELWSSDGTPSGTAPVSDSTETALGCLFPIVPVPDGVIFCAMGKDAGAELWRSDGSDAGTFLITDLAPGPASALAGAGYNLLWPDLPSELIARSGDSIYFAATNGSTGFELWQYSLVDGGMSIAAELNPARRSQSTKFAAGHELRGQAYFGVGLGDGGHLLQSDGGAASAVRGAPTSYGNLYSVRSRDFLFVLGNGGVWSFDGATFRLVGPGTTQWDYSRLPRAISGGVLFFAPAGSGWELRFSDGLTSTPLAAFPYDRPGTYRAVTQANVFTVVSDSLRGREPHVVTPAGVSSFDIWPGPYSSSVIDAVALPDGGFIFDADEPIAGRELYWAASSDAGILKDIAAGPVSSSPSSYALLKGLVYFAAWDPLHGRELWVTDGSPAGTQLFADLRPGPDSSNPQHLTVSADRLFFAADDGLYGNELHLTDGTPGSVQLVADLRTGVFGASPSSLAVIPGGIAFAANDGTKGREAHVSFGTEATTFRLGDIAAGSADSSPHAFVAVGNALVFAADDGQIGTEPYSVVLDESAPTILVDAERNDAGWITTTTPVKWIVTDAESPILDQSGCNPWFPTETVGDLLTCRATSLGGMTVEFFIPRVDFTPPQIACPQEVRVTTDGVDPVPAEFTVTATDSIDLAPTVTVSASAGALFPVGHTTVTASAADAAGHRATCEFDVIVVSTRQPAVILKDSCGCGNGALTPFALLALLVLWRRRALH